MFRSEMWEICLTIELSPLVTLSLRKERFFDSKIFSKFSPSEWHSGERISIIERKHVVFVILSGKIPEEFWSRKISKKQKLFCLIFLTSYFYLHFRSLIDNLTKSLYNRWNYFYFYIKLELRDCYLIYRGERYESCKIWWQFTGWCYSA